MSNQSSYSFIYKRKTSNVKKIQFLTSENSNIINPNSQFTEN